MTRSPAGKAVQEGLDRLARQQRLSLYRRPLNAVGRDLMPPDEPVGQHQEVSLPPGVDLDQQGSRPAPEQGQISGQGRHVGDGVPAAVLQHILHHGADGPAFHHLQPL